MRENRSNFAGEVDAATFEVLRHRLWAINDEAAVTIGRVSGSPIATEGNDFNSGLMTASGETVVAGIYVLVHAAALGRIVRDGSAIRCARRRVQRAARRRCG
jgi:N-methylhydantoinase B